MTRPPYSFCTGSQTLLVRKPRPYFEMAGHAPAISDSRMPMSIASVSSAAPLAAQPKMRSAMGPERGAFTGGGGAAEVRARSAARSREAAAAGKVDDTGRSGKDESGASWSEELLMGAPSWTVDEGLLLCLLERDRLARCVLHFTPCLGDGGLHGVGHRHVVEVVSGLVAALVGPVEELQHGGGAGRL